MRILLIYAFMAFVGAVVVIVAYAVLIVGVCASKMAPHIINI